MLRCFFARKYSRVSTLAVVSGAVQPSKVMDKSGRWVASPTVQGASQAHSFFGRPSKAAANSPTALQGVSNQPYNQSHGQGPIIASWSSSNGAAQHGSNSGSISSTSSALSPPAPGRWQGFTQMLRPRPRPHRHGSGPLLANTDPAVLSSIPESDPSTGVVDASLPAYQSTDLDAVNAASSANQHWALSATSLSPRRNSAASQGSGSQSAASQGSYVVPSPWSTPVKPPQSSSASPGHYLVPSPQNTPLGTPPQSTGQSPPAIVGPFEAAARAKAAQARAASSSSNANRSPPQAVYPVPSPATSSVQQQAPSDATSPAGSMTRASSQPHRSPSPAGRPASSPARDWGSAIPGMTTTKAAGSRRRRL